MDQYITGAAIRALREQKHLTQADLAGIIGVTDKAISRWETGRGYPDITLLEPLACALQVTVTELLGGPAVINRNRAGNLKKILWYVCPICGNLLWSMGEAPMQCCGLPLFPLEAEEAPESLLHLSPVENEVYVEADHPMSKDHYLSFLAFVSDDILELKKLYPEGSADARFTMRGPGLLYTYCNRHGLIVKRITRHP